MAIISAKGQHSMTKPQIPLTEYADRVRRAAALIA